MYVRHFLTSALRDVNEENKGALVNGAAIIYANVIFNEQKLSPLQNLEKYKFNKNDVGDLIKIIIIKNSLLKYHEKYKTLPDDIDQLENKDLLPRTQSGEKYYYKKLDDNWVALGNNIKSIDNNINYSLNNQIIKENDNMLLIFQIK